MKETVSAAEVGRMVIHTVFWECSPACGTAASCPWYYSVLVTQTEPASLGSLWGMAVKHIPISSGMLWCWADGWRFVHTMDIQGSKATSLFLDIGLSPQIRCVPLGKSREPQRKCDLLMQITLDSSSEGCEAVKENATAQGSLSWGHRSCP